MKSRKVLFSLMLALVLCMTTSVSFAETDYDYLQNAINSGTSFTLDRDLTLDSQVVIGKDFSLNLGGHTIRSNHYRPILVQVPNATAAGPNINVTISNGSIHVLSDDSQSSGLTVYDCADLTISDLSINTNAFGVLVAGLSASHESDLTCLTVEDGTSIVTKGTSLSTFGYYRSCAITINGGSVTSTESAAIYNPSDGIVTIKGGVLTGQTGIIMKAGTLNVLGGEIKATGTYTDPSFEYSGATNTGDAIAIDNCNWGGHGAPIINISGGSITSENGHSVASFSSLDTPLTPVDDFISGGIFDGGHTDEDPAQFVSSTSTPVAQINSQSGSSIAIGNSSIEEAANSMAEGNNEVAVNVISGTAKLDDIPGNTSVTVSNGASATVYDFEVPTGNEGLHVPQMTYENKQAYTTPLVYPASKLVFRSTAPFTNNWMVVIEKDGKEIKTFLAMNYGKEQHLINVKKGSTVVELKEDFVNTLPLGTYYVSIYNDTLNNKLGVSVPFVVSNHTAPVELANRAPQTGDNSNIALWISLMAISALSFVALGRKSRFN